MLCFFPLSTKVVYISLLCLACRLFSLYKRPVPEKGLIMWNAQFLLVQLPVVLREFCMGGCRCELKKMGRCWRNRRCCECEWKNWIVEHFLSCSKTNYWWKFYSEKKSVLSFVCLSVSVWGADLNDVENAVSFRKYLLMIRALTLVRICFYFLWVWQNWLEKHWASFAILTRKKADLLRCALGSSDFVE